MKKKKNNKEKIHNNNIIKQTEGLNNQCMTRLRNDGGTISQDGNLAQLRFASLNCTRGCGGLNSFLVTLLSGKRDALVTVLRMSNADSTGSMALD